MSDISTCARCGHRVTIGEFPFCPHGVVKEFAAHGDEVDYIDHNLGKEPVRIRSMAQRRELMKAAGLQEFVRHTPTPGTDKSPFTTDFSKGSIDPYTLEAARVLATRGRRVEEAEAPQPVANAFSFTAAAEDVRELVRAVDGGGEDPEHGNSDHRSTA